MKLSLDALRDTKAQGWTHKNVVLTLVERGGSARSFHVDTTSIAQIVPRSRQHRQGNGADDRRSPQYKAVGNEFESHESVNHGKRNMSIMRMAAPFTPIR